MNAVKDTRDMIKKCIAGIDISELKNIIGMELYFYQEPGSFLDKDKKEIPYKNEDEGFGSGNFANNLFTKSPYVCLGYSLDEFNSEKAILYTLNDETYKKFEERKAQKEAEIARLRATTIAPGKELNEILEKGRKDRGALDFEIPEAYIKVDENGKTCDIVQRERNTAHRIIESFMVLANEIVAKHFDTLKLPFVYRVHDKPTIEKMADFLSFVSGVGLKINVKPEQVTNKSLQQISKMAEEKDISKTVNEVMLRSMQKAMYDTTCRGHFGLGARYYCHFTSPIRRYPDLTINRIIKLSINNKLN